MVGLQVVEEVPERHHSAAEGVRARHQAALALPLVRQQRLLGRRELAVVVPVVDSVS